MQELFEGIRITSTYMGWSSEGLRVERVRQDPNKGKSELRCTKSDIFNFLVLDDPYYGELDSIYGLA